MPRSQPIQESATAEPGGGTGRIEAFSDGVFAVAITLLVLDLKVPRVHDLAPGKTLAAALLDKWPSYLAYVTSFLTILVMWVNHHTMFRQIGRSDHLFLFFNGLLLMAITAVPFLTSLTAEYLQHPGEQTAAAIYSGGFVFIALLYNLVWRYATFRGRLLAAGADRGFVRVLSRQYLFGPSLYGVTFLLAFVSVPLSLAVVLAIAVFFALPLPGTRG